VLGLCINAKDGTPDIVECSALGLGQGDWVRTPIQGSLSLLDGMLDRLSPFVSVMVALNSECDEVRGDWSGWESACAILASKYAGRVKIVGCGNELDLWHLQPPVGQPDPRLTPAFAADLVKRAVPILRPAGIKVAMSSVASGQWPDYLREMSRLCQGVADFADLHLYVKRLNGVPTNADWQTAEAALRDARDISGLPVISSEAGIKVDDAGGLERQAQWAAGLGTLPADLICYFAWSDGIGTAAEQGGQAFGTRGPNGAAKPVWFAMQRLLGGPLAEPGPEAARTVVPPEFLLGFRDWARADPALLGNPLENERGGIPGFSQQRTSRGILTAANIDGRGWTLVFWESSTGTRYVFEQGASKRIA
jgi:hypothetical protein